MTLIARKRGYALAMNRDEKLARPKGVPPSLRTLNGVKVLSPSEPDGGTWIALNETGVTLALINWYSVARRVEHDSVSRGEVVRTLSPSNSPRLVDAGLSKLPLRQMNPFRLIGIFLETREVVEWYWDLKTLGTKNHHWKTQQLASSGFDEPVAQHVRAKTFNEARKQTSAGTLDWLRRLHRSHSPEAGPYSICMHRTDAATVSYTEVCVSRNGASMRYHSDAPCRCREAAGASHFSCYLESAGDKRGWTRQTILACAGGDNKLSAHHHDFQSATRNPTAPLVGVDWIARSVGAVRRG